MSRGRAGPAVKQGIAVAQRKKVAKVVFIASERPTATTFVRRPPSLEAPVLKAPTVTQMRVSTACAWRNAWLIGPPGPTSSPASRPWIGLASWCTATTSHPRLGQTHDHLKRKNFAWRVRSVGARDEACQDFSSVAQISAIANADLTGIRLGHGKLRIPG